MVLQSFLQMCCSQKLVPVVGSPLLVCRLLPCHNMKQPLPHCDVAVADGLHLPYRSGSATPPAQLQYDFISFYNTSSGHVNPPGNLPVYFVLQILSCLPKNPIAFAMDYLSRRHSAQLGSVPQRDGIRSHAGALDGVLCIAVLHHISTVKRRIAMLAELARTLHCGGRALVTVWASEQEQPGKLAKWERIGQGGAASRA